MVDAGLVCVQPPCVWVSYLQTLPSPSPFSLFCGGTRLCLIFFLLCAPSAAPARHPTLGVCMLHVLPDFASQGGRGERVVYRPKLPNVPLRPGRLHLPHHLRWYARAAAGGGGCLPPPSQARLQESVFCLTRYCHLAAIITAENRGVHFPDCGLRLGSGHFLRTFALAVERAWCRYQEQPTADLSVNAFVCFPHCSVQPAEDSGVRSMASAMLTIQWFYLIGGVFVLALSFCCECCRTPRHSGSRSRTPRVATTPASSQPAQPRAAPQPQPVPRAPVAAPAPTPAPAASTGGGGGLFGFHNPFGPLTHVVLAACW